MIDNKNTNGEGGSRNPSYNNKEHLAENIIGNINIIKNIKHKKNTNNKKDNKNKYFEINKYIKIGTHNVRGFNVETKQWEMFDEYEYLDIDIIGLTETKLNEDKGKYTLNNKKTYKTW